MRGCGRRLKRAVPWLLFALGIGPVAILLIRLYTDILGGRGWMAWGAPDPMVYCPGGAIVRFLYVQSSDAMFAMTWGFPLWIAWTIAFLAAAAITVGRDR